MLPCIVSTEFYSSLMRLVGSSCLPFVVPVHAILHKPKDSGPQPPTFLAQGPVLRKRGVGGGTGGGAQASFTGARFPTGGGPRGLGTPAIEYICLR